ncbi:hypothetical protein OAA57_00985 [bacterium]|nr:hypothetical protein [bacterium]MDB4350137.1 hypothetical protein [bacterium]
MPRKIINTGTFGNDGTGDDLRTAGGKINDNFQELYNDVASLTLATGGSSSFSGLQFASDSVNGPYIVFEGATADSYETQLGVIDPTADRTVLLPDASGTVALASDINRNAIVRIKNNGGELIDSNIAIDLIRKYSIDSAELAALSVDSSLVIQLIDSSYIQARVTLPNLDSGIVLRLIDVNSVDSVELYDMVDSGWVQLRQSYNYNLLTNKPSILDSGRVKALIDSATIKPLIGMPIAFDTIDSAVQWGARNLTTPFLRPTVDSSVDIGTSSLKFRDAYIGGHLYTGGIRPLADSTYDIGDSNNRFKDLYLSGSTIYLGDVKLKAEQAGAALKIYDINDTEISFGGLNQSQVDARISLNTNDYATEAEASAYADSAINKHIPIGQAGEMLLYQDNNTRTLKRTNLFSVNDKFVEFYDEVLEEQADAPTLADVFNSWRRFSHNNTGTYPANASEMNAWVYNSGPNTISQPLNTGTATGFYSFDTYEGYTHTATFASTQSDNDIGFMVIGFVIDGGIEHTLTAVRQSNGGINGIGTWALVYNIAQASQAILADNSATAPGSGDWNQWTNGTTIYARKVGASLTIQTSQFNSTSLDPATQITFDLSSDSRTQRFVGPVPYGYGAQSQGGMTISNIAFEPDNPERLYWLDSSGTFVYEYDGALVQWTANAAAGLDSAAGNIFHNTKTGRTYFIDGDSAHAIGTVRQFNDVIYQRPVNRLPDSDMIGDLGLRAGMFATADGVNWDPAGKSGSVPYPVFWDGVTWNALY